MLWVIDPSCKHPENQGVEAIVSDWPGSHRCFLPALQPGDGPGPTTGYDCDAVVVMGSAASVYDPLPWLQELLEWVRPIVAGDVQLPLLAICFGHQLVAHAAGAPVGFVHQDQSKILGVQATHHSKGRLLNAGPLRVVTSHREEVQSVPSGFRLVASRPSCQIDGLEHEALPVFAYQFHPEAGDEFATGAGITTSDLDEQQRVDSKRVLSSFRDFALTRV